MTYSIDWLVQHYASFFDSFGIESRTLVSHFAEWKEKSNSDSVRDYLWYLFHVLLGETKKQITNATDYHRNLHEIYLKMLEFRVSVEEQKDNQLVQLIIRNKIQQWQYELPYPFHLQAISLNCCPYCERINGQFFEPEQVIEDPYFASAHCTNEQGCSCGYIPVKLEN